MATIEKKSGNLKKPVSFRLSETLLLDLKQRAEAEGVSLTELIARFSRQGLEGSIQVKLSAQEGQWIMEPTLQRELDPLEGDDEAPLHGDKLDYHLDDNSDIDGFDRAIGQVLQRLQRHEKMLKRTIPRLEGKIAYLEAQLQLQGQL